jgi:hypothetical protein
MAEEHLRLRWDGPAVDDHLIDVRDFAPSLLALGELVVAANRTLNGDKATVRVAISAGVEQNCFEIDIHFFLEALAVARGLLVKDEVSTIKDILEWLDILTPTGISAGVLMLFKELSGKRVKQGAVVQTADGHDNIQLNVTGDANTVQIYVNPQVWKLAKDPDVQENARKLLAPLKEPGYDTVTFESSSSRRAYSKADGDKIVSEPPLIENEDEETHVRPVEMWGTAYGPVFDEKADKWRFDFGEGAKTVDVSETSIGADAVRRGSVGKDDRYLLRLEQTQKISPRGIRTTYKALKVLDFVPGAKQQEMFRDDPEKGPKE